MIKVGAMVNARQFIACCIALALLLAGIPGHAMPAEAATSGAGPAPCHMGGDSPALHDADCASGCDSSPAPAAPGQGWAPASTRGNADDRDEASTLPPALGPPMATALRGADPAHLRGPPPLRVATPVARHDVLRD